MNTDAASVVAQLSNQELLARVHLLVQRVREATHVLITHLAEVDKRGLYLAEGYPSMFAYCTQVLQLSEYEAYGRIEAARALRKYPIILELLSEGSLTLTAVGLLVPHHTPANHREVLETARHKSKRQVQEIVAHLRPQPPVPSTIRKLPGAGKSVLPNTVASTPATAENAALQLSSPTPSNARPVVTPLAPERYKVQFTASTEGYANLRTAQDLLRHQIPDGDAGKVIEKALAVLVRELKKQKAGASEQHRAPRGTPTHSRHIPAEVKRKVWARDVGRCAFVAQDGHRCSEQGFLEFHHVVPYAAGGEATLDNIQLRCRAHNRYEAEICSGQTESDFRKIQRLGL